MIDAKIDPRPGDVFVKKSPSGRDVFRFVKSIDYPNNNRIIRYTVKNDDAIPSVATEKEWSKWVADAEVRTFGRVE